MVPRVCCAFCRTRVATSEASDDCASDASAIGSLLHDEDIWGGVRKGGGEEEDERALD